MAGVLDACRAETITLLEGGLAFRGFSHGLSSDVEVLVDFVVGPTGSVAMHADKSTLESQPAVP